MYFCPTPRYGDNVDWPCIRYSDLCNNAIDCPQGEDEHPSLCLFHNLVSVDAGVENNENSSSSMMPR